MLTALMLFSLLGQAPALPALRVTALGMRTNEGKALFLLYRDKRDWNDGENAYRRQTVGIQADRAVAVFERLAPGTYAVAVVHDANDNGKLDFSWFPVPGPDEGVGSSNDAPARLGPPKWEDAKLSYAASGAAITIRMRY